MKFLNFYTLTSKIFLAKNYVHLLVLVLVLIFTTSFVLNRLDIVLTGNDLIKEYQIHKIKSKEFKDVPTIFVGDSSCGNAINATYFSQLSKQKSVNLALTGSWGFAGSLGMIKQAIKHNPKIKNIIIIQTPDIWKRELPEQSFLELYEFPDIYNNLKWSTIFSYYFNPKEFFWNIQQSFQEQNINDMIDYENDYVVQKKKKYSNNQKHIYAHQSLNTVQVNKAKIKELTMLNNYCKSESLNCIFLKGPLHKKITDSSMIHLNKIDSLLKTQNELIYFKNNFSYENECIGDSLDHIDTKCKKEVTLEYFNIVKNKLISDTHI